MISMMFPAKKLKNFPNFNMPHGEWVVFAPRFAESDSQGVNTVS